MSDKQNLDSEPDIGIQEIPSVVAASQKKNTLMIAGFLGFMTVVALVVCRKPNQKVSDTVPQQELPSGPSLPAAVVYPKPNFPVEAIMSRPRSVYSGDSALMDVRRKSPIVIFNKQSSSGNGTGSYSGGNTGIMTPPSFGNSTSGQNGGVGDSGVPMPDNFKPTNAATAMAAEIGDRQEKITQGKLLDAVLETAINSDHPGMLRAILSHDIYGDTGRQVLLPRGSRLIGQYDSAVAKGQNRVFVIWQRAIRPDGIDIQLGSAGTDTLGQGGIEGNVNNHFLTMFGAATLLSVIGASASVLSVNPSDQNNSLAQYRESVTNGFSNAAGTVLGQFVQIKPTITVKQGVEIKVFVARDLYFDQVLSMNNGIQYIQ